MFKFFEELIIKHHNEELGKAVLLSYIEARKEHVRKYNSTHFMSSDNGTGVTNFGKRDIFGRPSHKIYERAIERYNDPRVFIVKAPMLSGHRDAIHSEDTWSLHNLDLNDKRSSLSDFWRIYEDVCKEYDLENENA